MHCASTDLRSSGCSSSQRDGSVVHQRRSNVCLRDRNRSNRTSVHVLCGCIPGCCIYLCSNLGILSKQAQQQGKPSPNRQEAVVFSLESLLMAAVLLVLMFAIVACAYWQSITGMTILLFVVIVAPAKHSLTWEVLILAVMYLASALLLGGVVLSYFVWVAERKKSRR